LKTKVYKMKKMNEKEYVEFLEKQIAYKDELLSTMRETNRALANAISSMVRVAEKTEAVSSKGA
jgi:hypothetical protein